MSSKNENRALQKSKGKAIKGLKAYIKALELGEGYRVSKQKYRYEIAEDGSTARVLTAADGVTVEGTERPLAEWAKIGTEARHALIGLRFTKDKLDRQGARVLYTLNVITQEANITQRGDLVEDQPTTIAEWAKLGKTIEQREFESKRAAEDYNNADAVQTVIDNMVRWGIIRTPPKDAASETAD